MNEILMTKLKSDPFAKHLNAAVEDIGEGVAKVSMKATDSMLNFHGTVNGGVIFALADFAFAIASNSHGKTAVGIHVDIDYHMAAYEGDTLTAYAEENMKNHKLGWYNISVRNQDDTLIASAKGIVYRKSAPIE